MALHRRRTGSSGASHSPALWVILSVLSIAACRSVDAGLVDAGSVDAGSVDAGSVDAGLVDAGLVDAGFVDAGLVDAGSVDAGAVVATIRPSGGFVGVFSHSVGKQAGTEVAAYFDKNPYLAGITIKKGWKDIQPTDGPIDWSSIDSTLTVAGERGKQVHLVIIPGFLSPEWIYGAPHNVPYLKDVTVSGTVGNAPIAWDPTYVALFDSLIDRTAEFLANHPYGSAVTAVEIMGQHYRGEEMQAPPGSVFKEQGFELRYDDAYANWQHWIDRFNQRFPNKQLILVISQSYSGAGTDGSNLSPLLNEVTKYFVDQVQPSGRAVLQTDQLDGRRSLNSTTGQVCTTYNTAPYTGDAGVPNGHEMLGNFETQPYRQGRAAMVMFNLKSMLNPYYAQIWSGNINKPRYAKDLLREWYRYRDMSIAEARADLEERGLYLATTGYSATNRSPEASDTEGATPNGTPIVVTLTHTDPGAPVPSSASQFTITQPPTAGNLGPISFEGGRATVTYTPAQSDVVDRFRWTVSDENTTSNVAIATIEVGTVSHDPEFTRDPIHWPTIATAQVGIAYQGGTLFGMAVDIDSSQTESLVFGKRDGPAWLSVGADGRLSGTPVLGDVGENRWTVSATDSTGRIAYATLVISVSQ